MLQQWLSLVLMKKIAQNFNGTGLVFLATTENKGLWFTSMPKFKDWTTFNQNKGNMHATRTHHPRTSTRTAKLDRAVKSVAHV